MPDPKAPAKPGQKKPPSVNTDELLRRLELDKKSRIFLQLAEEYRKQDYIDSALSVLREGLKHHPHFQPAHVALARCLMAKKQYSQAQAELTRVHEKSPDNILAGKLLSEVLEARGERQRALEVLRTIARFSMDDPEVLQRLSTLQAAMSPPKPRPEASLEGETGEYLTGDFVTGNADLHAFGTPPLEVPPEPPPADVPDPTGVPTEEHALDDADELPFEFPAAPPPVLDAVGAGDELLGAPRTPTRDDAENDFTSLTLAELYESQGEHGEAAAIYERLVARRPDDAELRRALARCNARSQGEQVASVPSAPVAAPPAKPRWQPVRPRAATQPGVTPGPAGSLARSATRGAPAAPGRGAQADAPSQAHLRAALVELRRWLAAAQAVRQ